MTRSWTDPRTGKRWHIDVVRRQGAPDPAPGKGAATEATSALVFGGREGSFSYPTEDATRLEALEDEKLAELLDLAKDAGSPEPEPKTERNGQAPGDPAGQQRRAKP